MNHDYTQRRRVALAAAITVIAVPAVFLFKNEDTVAVPSGPVVGTVVDTLVGTFAPAAGDELAVAPAVTDVMGSTPVAYLEGDEAINGGDPATIAIPRLPLAINGTASFRRDLPDVTRCQAKGVPFDAKITVTNLDNSRSVRCIASVGGAEPDDDVVLHNDAFLLIADLTDAPVPVSITW